MSDNTKQIIVEPHELPGTIFMQPWWLDIVAKNAWTDITITKGNQIYARWPIVMHSKMGIKFIKMPLLTQKLGPYIRHDSDKQETKHRNERSLLKELIDLLPKHDYMLYNLNEDIINYLPFKWAGFTQSSVTSFRINYPFEPDEVWKGVKNSVRRNIRRAREGLYINKDITPEESYKLVQMTYERQNKKTPFSLALYSKLIDTSSAKGRSTLVGVSDQSGTLHATQFFIHDDEVTYYLVGGLSPDSQYAGAASFGMWEGILEASNRDNTFDFEGSSIEQIESFFSSFGSSPIHFHKVKRVSSKLKLWDFLKN